MHLRSAVLMMAAIGGLAYFFDSGPRTSPVGRAAEGPRSTPLAQAFRCEGKVSLP